ncbi:hypothetical protein ACNH6C_18280 [Bdellovibrio bacteriovorus]|uniref:hypothetical protein n=1 Tax=Bdellovibrio bacteriovorus TaxID=959 RepID=UPI003A80130F
MDIVFAVVTIIAFCFSQKTWESFKTTFGFNNKVLLVCLSLYLGSGIIGYFLYSPMEFNEWTKIASLRWIFGLFACYAVGHVLALNSKRINWYFSTLLLVLILIIFRQYQLTSGEMMTQRFRLQGFYSNPNYFALALALVWAMVLSFVLYSRNCASKASAALVLTCNNCDLYTHSLDWHDLHTSCGSSLHQK